MTMPMNVEKQMPVWAQWLFDTIASTIEFKGPASLEGRYSAPSETDWGVDLLELAPALLELGVLGPKDGEPVYGLIHNLDLLAAQQAFDEIAALTFGFENDGRPYFTFEGNAQGHEITVVIYTSPFGDAEVSDTIK